MPLDGTSPVLPPDPDRIHQILLSVLPVTGTPKLMEDLARAWHQLTSAGVVVVSYISPSEQRVRGCAVGDDGWVQSNDSAKIPGDTESWQTAHADAAIDSLPEQVRAANKRRATVPFLDGERAIGGAVLLMPEPSSIDTAALTPFAQLCTRLILQARCLDEARSCLSSDDRLTAAKLEALAEFAAGAGHEINNPVATIAGRAQLLLKGETDPERRQALATIGGQAYRIRDMIGDVMLFARPPRPQPELLDLNQVVDTVLAKLQDRAGERQCTFERSPDCAAETPIWADRVQLSVVLSSLLQNSLDAVQPPVRIVLTVRPHRDGESVWAYLSVADDGPGLSPEEREHLFDPFYSGRQAGRGLGFGLAKCWRIVSHHQGRIEVESTPDSQTIFKVYWPAGEAG